MPTDLNTFNEIDPVLFILNEKNKKITKKYIEGMLKKYGINLKVNNLKYFQRAMVHTSYQIRDLTQNLKTNKNGKNRTSEFDPIKNPDDAIPLQDESYERLEFLGDSVLHLILAHYLWHRYANTEAEGFMTRLRTKIENGETLADLCKAINLNQYIFLSRFIEKNGGRENNFHILEDAFEAFMAALYLEAGFNVCKDFFITTFSITPITLFKKFTQ
jgi:dsRNA-specific ribonuclease